MNPTTEIPTPRADALAVRWTDVKSDTWYVPRIHARALERELATAKQQAAQADELYNHMHDFADERDKLRAELKTCAVALKEAQFMVETVLAIPFFQQPEAQPGSPADLIAIALKQPLIAELLKQLPPEADAP